MIIDAIGHGRLDIVILFDDMRFEFDSYTMKTAIINKKTNVMNYLKHKIDHDDPSISRSAVCHDRVDMMKWIAREGFVINDTICGEAVYRDALNVLRWAIETMKIKPTSNAFRMSERTSIETIEYLIHNDCPRPDNIQTIAIQCGNIQLAEWLGRRNL
jgi:hypothetical protein